MTENKTQLEKLAEKLKALAPTAGLSIYFRYNDLNKPEHRCQIVTSVIDTDSYCSEGEIFFKPAPTFEQAVENALQDKTTDIVGWFYDDVDEHKEE